LTYSIIAHDPQTGELGAAVQSHFFGVGRVVPWAAPGVGVVATQAFAEISYGPRGLAAMEAGASASEALRGLLAHDEARESRQVAMLDVEGDVAVFTGEACVGACGHQAGLRVCAQGNMLLSDRAWGAMIAAYQAPKGDMAGRLLAALDAAEATGGDTRGRQSAAILVVTGGRGDPAWAGPRVDCRVDDHPDPLVELRRLVDLNRFYDRLLEMFSEPGLLAGDASAGEEVVTQTLGELGEGERLLGENQEATMWRGILLARFGHDDAACGALAEAIARRPELVGYLRQMPAAGILTPAVLDRVLPPGR
jgi:uncharacterized Ntn-hydrolase superfamily protein